MFKAVAGRERLTEFLILSVEELDAQSFNISRATIKNKMKMVQIECCRKDEFGCPDQETFYIKTHLGEYLNIFNTVLGYDLVNMPLSELDDYRMAYQDKSKHHMPEIVLVKKIYPKVRKY